MEESQEQKLISLMSKVEDLEKFFTYNLGVSSFYELMQIIAVFIACVKKSHNLSEEALEFYFKGIIELEKLLPLTFNKKWK